MVFFEGCTLVVPIHNLGRENVIFFKSKHFSFKLELSKAMIPFVVLILNTVTL